MVSRCNMFTLLVARVSRMWRGHPSLGRPPPLQIPADTGTGIRRWRPRGGPVPFHTHILPIAAAEFGDQTIHGPLIRYNKSFMFYENRTTQ
jgi:hypothetical protein